MTQVHYLKLIVTPSANCKKVLLYFNRNIQALNDLGIHVRIEKIGKKEFDEVIVEKLRKVGITGLPALVTPSGKIYIGYEEIVKICDHQLRGAVADMRISPTADPSSVEDYMKSIMDEKDREEEDTEVQGGMGKNFEKKMAALNGKRMATQRPPPGTNRRNNGGVEMDDSPPRRRRAGRNDDPNREYTPGDGETPDMDVRPPRTGGATKEDKMDDDIVNAWLVNNIDAHGL